MMIREPMVQATHFYLREAPGDSDARRRDRHEAFVVDAHRLLGSLAGWLALPTPELPPIPAWEGSPPEAPQELARLEPLQGYTNASAILYAYVLRNMLLLRVIVTRSGEHDHAVWSMLDEVLNHAPNTPSWLHMTRYWCAIAPRPPEDLEQDYYHAAKTSFGVLCLGQSETPHVLVYPDARTQARATAFLSRTAAQLDWYAVQARFRMNTYTNHASGTARQEHVALDRVRRATQVWGARHTPSGIRALSPLRVELDTLESTYHDVLADLAVTRATAQELDALATEYRLALMRSGLWDVAPTVWEAQVNRLASLADLVKSDLGYIDDTLRRMDLALRLLETRITVLRSERERLLVYVVALIGLGLLLVQLAGTDPVRLAILLAGLVVVGVIGWWGLRFWAQRHQSTD